MVVCKLKLIKEEHRSTMSQNRQDYLTLLGTERDIVRRINLDTILSERANNSFVFEKFNICILRSDYSHDN